MDVGTEYKRIGIYGMVVMYEVMEFKLCSESGKKKSVLTAGKVLLNSMG